jgi:hypothetical protein
VVSLGPQSLPLAREPSAESRIIGSFNTASLGPDGTVRALTFCGTFWVTGTAERSAPARDRSAVDHITPARRLCSANGRR